MDHINVTFKPDERAISIHVGSTLLEAAELAGIVLNTVCGGKGTCRKCTVLVEPDGIPVQACQYNVTSDIVVTIPERSRFFKQKILDHGFSRSSDIDPSILKNPPFADDCQGDRLFGVAVDIGTTTVVAKLIGLDDGENIATASMANPQIKYGDDVISRITHASTEKGLEQLHRTIVKSINKLIEQLCDDAGIKNDLICEVTTASNTTMNHLLLKLPVAQLGLAPYCAYSTEARNVSAEEINLHINPAGRLHTIENIAGFVGSDTVAVALAVAMDTEQKNTLIVDIGTNGEIILGTKNRMVSASCAAGPAFEGARIDFGSRAVDGAIEAVVIDGDDIGIDVIGNVQARSICGSGLLDAIAVLLDLGVIDTTGRFNEPENLPEPISNRFTQYNNQPAFLLSENVPITQKDIREAQLAKAAIRTGVAILQKELSISDKQIEQVLLAGAFGNYIRRESALRIGLLPKVEVEKVKFVGNAASSGAILDMLSEKCRGISKMLAEKIEYVEIATRIDFQEMFADAIMFNQSSIE